jgi:hypothetical protein
MPGHWPGKEGLPMAKPRITKSPEQWAKLITERYKQTIRAFLETGRALIQAKKALGHGKFTAMVETLPFGQRTAERLIAIASNPVLSNPTHVSRLPASWGTLYQLAKLPKQTLLERLEDGTINPALERSEAEQWASTTHRKIATKSERATLRVTQPAQTPCMVQFPLLPGHEKPKAEPGTSQPTGESYVQAPEIDGYQSLRAAWEMANPHERRRFLAEVDILVPAWEAKSTAYHTWFLAHVGARFLS